MSDALVDDDALRFFNDLSGRLAIQLSEPPHPISPGLANLVAPPTARLERVALAMSVFEREGFRDLSEEEWGRIVLRTSRVRMRDARAPGISVEVDAPGDGVFTVRDLARAIEVTERRCRAESDWFEGVDVHHVYFEGMALGADGVWEVQWGS